MPFVYRCRVGTRLQIRLLLCAVLFLSALLPGCGMDQAVRENVSFDMSGPPVIYKNQWARREAPTVFVRPEGPAGTRPTAIFMPFRVTQVISNPEIVGYSQARTFWQTWLSMRVFSVLEFDGDRGPYRRDVALARARQKGAELAIGGFVTYYYAGGSESDSQVAVQLEIYDTASGQLLWSMGQSAYLPKRVVNDYIIFATQIRLPTDPMYALAKTIAEDMGAELAAWVGTEKAPQTKGLLDLPGSKQEAAPEQSAF